MTVADLPTHQSVPAGLASVTRLRQLRRQPAPRQKPVARLLYHGNKHADLYRIDDAELLPPLNARQRAAVVAQEDAHLCGECGRYDIDALPALPSGGRRCVPCGRIRRILQLLEARPGWRDHARQWAEHVLADPTAVLFKVRTVAVRQPPTMTRKREAVVDVAILPISGIGEADYLLHPQEAPTRKRDLPPAGRPIVEVAAEITDRLVGRRLVAWQESEAWHLATDLRDAATGYGKGRTDTIWSQPGSSHQLLRVPEHRTLRKQYSDWVGQIAPNSSDHAAVQQPVMPGQPIDQVHWMLRVLRRMAEAAV
ncbi:hypothetical protein [Phytohabitans houttuyneae]|uniref:Uncharacterized protein n=1 Tax=Phytohabitans houttuyneae TaxID=1076126 RepID=A0A6V8KB67_9ACTN|nr:hypothetical protein [Phytohabitans houttuyneae]GFJ79409.1 hypothetical protein Phou_035890 [Phytohabitans houttuyneae]